MDKQKNKYKKCPGENYARKTWVFDSYGKTTFPAKIALALFAILISAALLIICVYIIIPAIINSASDKIEENLAKQIYQSTLSAPAATDDGKSVFVQPIDKEPLKTTVAPRSLFAAALDANPDVVGRVSIASTGISYLVLQSDDNEHYLKTGYDGKESRSGAIFLDYRCDAGAQPLKGNYILYGHNMKNGSMFHNLMKYKDKEFLLNNRMIRFDTLYQDYNWEIFSAYITSTDFHYIDTSFENDLDWLDFLRTVQQKSIFNTGTSLSADDVVLTLSTCSYEFDNARFVVHARLIK